MFGSIHALLNHILLGDTIWQARFLQTTIEGGGAVTPALNTILYAEFRTLRAARAARDASIEAFSATLTDDARSRSRIIADRSP